MSATDNLPCIELPNPPPLTITLPFGVVLNPVMDISKGPPTDCTLIHSLLLQLSPALAGMECLFKIIGVISAIADIKTPPDILNVASKAAALTECIAFPAQIACMIVDILKIVIGYLNCIIQALVSLLNFQVGIDFNAAQGNPVLLASLNCAQNNATASTDQLKQALAVIKPLLKVMTSLSSMASPALFGPAADALNLIPKTVNTLTSILENGGATLSVQGMQDSLATLNEIKTALTDISQTLDSLPC